MVVHLGLHLHLYSYSLSNDWADALEGRDFMGGREPNMADLAVFGVLQAVRGTDTFTEIMEVTRLTPWYMRMVKALPKSKGKRLQK